MAAKKGKIPEHIKQKQKKFHNPQADHPIITIFNEIDDPRKPSLTFSYPLTSILFMTLVAVISGATDWAKVVVMSEGMTDWLALYVDMSSRVPCERTFTNIFNVIKKKLANDQLRWESEVKKAKEQKDRERLEKII